MDVLCVHCRQLEHDAWLACERVAQAEFQKKREREETILREREEREVCVVGVCGGGVGGREGGMCEGRRGRCMCGGGGRGGKGGVYGEGMRRGEGNVCGGDGTGGARRGRCVCGGGMMGGVWCGWKGRRGRCVVGGEEREVCGGG